MRQIVAANYETSADQNVIFDLFQPATVEQSTESYFGLFSSSNQVWSRKVRGAGRQ
jgi:hypothetical protein